MFAYVYVCMQVYLYKSLYVCLYLCLYLSLWKGMFALLFDSICFLYVWAHIWYACICIHVNVVCINEHVFAFVPVNVYARVGALFYVWLCII